MLVPLLQKKQNLPVVPLAGRNLVETAFTHYFTLIAVALQQRNSDFQRAEKQHKIVATAIFDASKNLKWCIIPDFKIFA